jgi:uncharacterized cupredoxin-like copper-binding protein
MARRLWILALVAVFALGVIACEQQEPDIATEDQVGADQRAEEAEANGDDGNGDDGNGEEAPAGETVTFVAVDIDFEDAPTEVPAGDVTFELVNEGNLEHNVVLDDLGDELVVEAMGGETATGNIELEPGTYEFHCDIPGHENQMRGEFEVVE